jgi:hydrogenase maturation protease
MSDPGGFWEEMTTPPPDTADVGGVELRRGSRVRLSPRAGGDVFDVALDGRLAVVEGVEQDQDGTLQVAVTLVDDPGRDLGEARFPGHRFFFGLDEVEPIEGSVEPTQTSRRILVAGIGNVFLGDDGFGVAVANRLAERPFPPGVEVADFGIRGMDLAFTLQEGYDAVILVDASPRGEAPGTLTVVDAGTDPGGEPVIESHGMDPVRVLAFARSLGGAPPLTLVVACEPATVMTGASDEDIVGELSAPVQAAIPEAVALVESLVNDLLTENGGTKGGEPK